MATILLTWELGGGLGHLMNLRPLAQELSRRGHRVFAALRDLSLAREVLGDFGVEFLQAPFKHERMREIQPCCTFAHILHNVGFCNVGELATMAGAWRQLYSLARPDLIVFDHSPTALLAARGWPARTALMGHGFFSPPDVSPMPNLRTWLKVDPQKLEADETHVLDNINRASAEFGQPPLARVAELFSALNENFLLTFPELDTYRRQASAIYYGMWNSQIGEPPQWPAGEGPRIFGYLKTFAEIQTLLQHLRGLRNPILLFAPGIDLRLKAQFAADHLRFADRPVEMGQVARECNVAILNGTIASTTAMLLAGKPTLHIPIFLEQATNAHAVERLRAGICASPSNPAAIIAGLRCLLAIDQYAEAARRFAERYASFNPKAQIERIVSRIEELAANTVAANLSATHRRTL